MSKRHRTQQWSRLTAASLGLAMIASACSTGTTDPGRASGDATPTTDLSSDEIILTSGLGTVNSCDDLLTELQAEGMERVGPYGFGQNGGPIFLDDMAMESDDAMEESTATFDTDASVSDTSGAARSSAAGEGSSNFSSTNVQEAGVDEADRVKTDGKRLVAVANGYLNVLDVSGDEPGLERSIRLPEDVWDGELFMVGDSALLMTSGWTDLPFGPAASSIDWFPGSPTTQIVEIDLETGKTGSTLEFEGGYLSAREIDGSIRIVLTASANRFNFLFPSNEGATDQAEKANKDIIAESTIDQWIPTFRLSDGSTVVEEGPIVDCDRVHLPGSFAGFGSVVVLTADVDNGLSINDSLSIFTDANTVYASMDRLVVATPRWPEFDPSTGEPLDDETYRTALHTFDITDPNKASYQASGTVVGNLLSQYSLSEYEGYLRVATTAGSPWNSQGSESFVTVMAENGSTLESVGQVGGLGIGEQIFAVRFLGNKGYVVTFEQIDPLYVVDLSDPTDPEVKGELKIPGFSSYLHPLDDDLLLGVGTDGDETGATQGAVASLFDVSDPTDPKLIDKMPLGPTDLADADEVYSYSQVASDPRAFTYWDDTALIPVGWWGYSERNQTETNGSAVELITVDGDELNKVGSVRPPVHKECDGMSVEVVEEFEDQFEEDEAVIDEESDEPVDAEAEFAESETQPAPRKGDPEHYCWSFQPEIYRTVIVDGKLYSVTYNGVVVNDFESLEQEAWIPFKNR